MDVRELVCAWEACGIITVLRNTPFRSACDNLTTTNTQGANMQWYYESAGAQSGPVDDQALRQMLNDGRISGETLVWRQGQENWSPLRQIRPDMFVADSGGTGPSVLCDTCGRVFPSSSIISLGGRNICAECKPNALASLQLGKELSSVSEQRSGPPFEYPGNSFFPSILETIKLVLTDPSRTFSTMKREGGLGKPLTFFMIAGGIGSIVSLIAQLLISSAVGSNQFANADIPMVGIIIGAIILLPIGIALNAFIGAGITHLSGKLCGLPRDFETTFRVYCYAFGAGTALAVIPFCGQYAGGIWGLVVCCIGMAKAHEVSTGKGVLAVLLPVVVCCVALILFYALFFAALFGMSGMKQ